MLKMKKIFIIFIAALSIALLAFLGWYLFLRNPNIPAGEIIRNILPFGSGDSSLGPATDDRRSTTEGGPAVSDEFGQPTANLFRISQEPVAGAVILNRGTSTVVARYVERATGHIYDTDLTTLTKTRVTNQTLTKVYEAYFRPDGNAVLLRFLKEDSDVVENISLALTPPRATLVSTSSPQATDALYSVSAIALRGNIGSVAVGAGGTLFYTLEDASSVVSSNFNGTGTKTIFSSAFKNWRLAAAGNNLITYTKASAGATGYAYNVNIKSGALTKVAGPFSGLVATPSAIGNKILYSYIDSNRTRLFAKNIQNNAVSEMSPVTLAEKCVWSIKSAGIVFCGAPADGLAVGEPDSWYRGLTHFSDRIWLFDTNIETAEVLVEPRPSLGIDIDLMEPKLSPNEDYLVFINKTDLSLWALRLE